MTISTRRSFYHHSARAFVVPLVYWFIFGTGILGGMAVPKIKAHLGIKDPNAERIVTLQTQVQQLDKKLTDAQNAKDTAVNTAKTTIKDASQVAHQEVHGAAVELGKSQPNIATVKSLVTHADNQLTQIFGPLSDDQVAQINAVIAAQVGEKTAALEATLAEKDKQVTDLVAANKAAEAKIVESTQTITSLQVEKAQKVEKLNTTTADVVAKTNELVAKARELTGWGSYWAQVKFYLYLALGIYVFVHFLMPSIDDELDKHYPASGDVPVWVKGFHSIYTLLKTLTCAH